MGYSPLGKHVGAIDPWNPKALGVCDRTGFVHRYCDLRKQMEWRGNRLEWTGLLVGKDYLDKPNPQLRPFQPKQDPVPVINPRPPFNTIQLWNTTQTLWNTTTDIWNSLDEIKNGVPALPNSERLREAQNAYFGSFS